MRRKFPALDQQFPRPLDRFLLEIIAEAPVAEHLEERVVIRIESDVIQIVMLPAGADAFLRVGDAGRIPRRLLLPEKNRDELVHARVREKQVRRVRQKRSRRHNRVLFLAKEIEKGLADFGGSHRAIKLTEAAHISKWKCYRVRSILCPSNHEADQGGQRRAQPSGPDQCAGHKKPDASAELSRPIQRRELGTLISVSVRPGNRDVLLAKQNLSVPGLYYDEAVFAGMAKDFLTGQIHGQHMPGYEVTAVFGRPFPLFVQSYLGALKSWMLMPGFQFFGHSVAVLRSSNLFWGLISLLFFMLGTWRWLGLRTALFAGSLLALGFDLFFPLRLGLGRGGSQFSMPMRFFLPGGSLVAASPSPFLSWPPFLPAWVFLIRSILPYCSLRSLAQVSSVLVGRFGRH